MLKIRNIDQLITAIKEDEKLRHEIVSNPEKAIGENFRFAPDTPVYRYVVIFLGLAVVFIIVGYFLITVMGKGQLDSAIIALASASVGALAGLLAPQPS